jgi:hypothetical protein
MRAPVTEEAAIAAEIARIRSLGMGVLRGRWRAEFGRKPPAGLSQDLLGRMIAWQIQERAFGGLDREALAFLDSRARQSGSPRRQLKPGTVLVREYQGQRHNRYGRARWLRLAGDDVSEPVGDCARHHRHGLERAALLCPAGCR